LKEELFFQDKERDCVECEKEKELQVSFGLSTRQEWDNIMNLIKKYGLSRDEINYIYGFYNRVLAVVNASITYVKILRKDIKI